MKNPNGRSRAGARLRRGFTLTEMLTTLVILGIVGGALIKLIMVQARFSQSQMALRSARNVSRDAMNIMLTDLRMVQDSGGLVAASRDSVTVRIPIAFGLVCSTSGGGTTISLLPADSAMLALGVYAGYAIRDSTSGLYNYTVATTPTPVNSLANGLAATCTAAGITTVGYGSTPARIVTLLDSPVGTSNVGWPAFIYQLVTYKFAGSSAYPGRRGLWRLVKTQNPTGPVTDEIIAPFDTSSKFRFYALSADAAQDTLPTKIGDVRGVELVLAGSSNEQLTNNVQAKRATMVTGVFFKNRRDP
jgi:prepilin-type N-terminal cleavage/methylation domain-containing protein